MNEEAGKAMTDVDVNGRLVSAIEAVLDDLGVTYTSAKKVDKTTRRTVFQMNKARNYCYVLYEDNVSREFPGNLVFRFRNDAKPKNWFSNVKVSTLTRNWASRFQLAYRDVPANFQEHAIVTAQFGLSVAKADLDNSEFVDTMKTFLLISVEAAKQANRWEKKRDWKTYDKLIE